MSPSLSDAISHQVGHKNITGQMCDRAARFSAAAEKRNSCSRVTPALFFFSNTSFLSQHKNAMVNHRRTIVSRSKCHKSESPHLFFEPFFLGMPFPLVFSFFRQQKKKKKRKEKPSEDFGCRIERPCTNRRTPYSLDLLAATRAIDGTLPALDPTCQPRTGSSSSIESLRTIANWFCKRKPLFVFLAQKFEIASIGDCYAASSTIFSAEKQAAVTHCQTFLESRR